MTVIDAKYVGRVHVEQRAAELHEKYSRMRLQGKPIVDWVYAALPHTDLNISWRVMATLGLPPGHLTHSVAASRSIARETFDPQPTALTVSIEVKNEPVAIKKIWAGCFRTLTIDTSAFPTLETK